MSDVRGLCPGHFVTNEGCVVTGCYGAASVIEL